MLRLLLLSLLPFLFAFNFSPMTNTLNIEKTDKTQFQIQNSSNKPIPILLKVKQRIQNSDGTEKLPDTDDFQIIPPQVIVPPKDKRSIRLTYKGKKDLKGERSYRVIAEQVPLNVGEKKSSGIEMLLKYQAALYVSTDDFKSQLQVTEVKMDKKLRIMIANKGDAHQYLKNIQLYFEKEGKKIALEKSELKKLEGQNILAGVSRSFEFSLPKGLDKSYQIQFKYD